MNATKFMWLWMAITATVLGFYCFAYVEPIGLGGWEFAITGIIGFGLGSLCFTRWQEMSP
jgi:hypothetical protein